MMIFARILLLFVLFFIYSDATNIKGYESTNSRPTTTNSIVLPVAPHPNYKLMEYIFIYFEPFEVFGSVDDKFYVFNSTTSEIFNLDFNFSKYIIKVVIFNKYNRVFSYTRCNVNDITHTDVGQKLLNAMGPNNHTKLMESDNDICPLYCNSYNIRQPFTVECVMKETSVYIIPSYAELFRIRLHTYINHDVLMAMTIPYNFMSVIPSEHNIRIVNYKNIGISSTYILNYFTFLNNGVCGLTINCGKDMNKFIINPKINTTKPTTIGMIDMERVTDDIKTSTLSIKDVADIKSSRLEIENIHEDVHHDKVKIEIILIPIGVLLGIIIVIGIVLFVYCIKNKPKKTLDEIKTTETLI